MKYLRRSLFILLAFLILFPVKTHAETLRWFGSKLSGTEKEIYDEIVRAYEHLEDGEYHYFTGIEGCDMDKVGIAEQCFLNDYPEAYWIRTMWRSDEFMAPVFYEGISEDREEIDREIQKAMDYVGKYSGVLDKIRAINDYICHLTLYGNTVDEGQSIRGGLLKKYKNTFVCAGHSRLFQLLCVKNNIPCVYVSGKGHAFNFVQYENKWYLVDVTWNHPFLDSLDSGEQIYRHDYLMRGRDTGSEFHQQLDPYVKTENLTIDYPEIAAQTIVCLADVDKNGIEIDYDDFDEEGFYYTGKEVRPGLPSIEMIYDCTKIGKITETSISYYSYEAGLTLEQNKDYKISYRNNVKVGKGEMVITGIGRCYGSIVIPFNIVKEMEYEEEVDSISVSGISHDIAAGKTIQLTAKVLPKDATNKKLKWSSSNTKIATVTQTGKVKIKKGTGGKSVTIVAKATDGSGVSKSFKIKVMKGAVKSVTIKGAKKTLKVGKQMKLKAVVKTSKGKPVNKKIKWSSDKTKYATVSSKGVVKAKKPGKGKKVKITAMATDGSGKKKTITIKIK